MAILHDPNRTGYFWYRWLVLLILLAVSLSACAGSPRQVIFTPTNHEPDIQATKRAPIDCTLAASFDYDLVEGQGYRTPREAFDHLEPEDRPTGNPSIEIEEADSVTWIVLENGKKIWTATVVRSLGGLWIPSYGERCIEE